MAAMPLMRRLTLESHRVGGGRKKSTRLTDRLAGYMSTRLAKVGACGDTAPESGANHMWSVLNGTIVNVVTVAFGSLLGLSISGSLPERYRTIVLQALGLITVTLGIDAAVLRFSDTVAHFAPLVQGGKTYGARLAMVMIGSLLIGTIIGTALRLHERIESAGAWIHGRFSAVSTQSASTPLSVGATGTTRLEPWGERSRHQFAEGFLTASVIFCVGPLTLLGCLENGAHGNPSFLYIKSLLDGFCSMALASAMGWGVFGSVLTVLFFQGGLSLLAYWVAEPLDELSIALMTAVGGVVLLATALMILDLKKIAVANMLPGIFLPPLVIWMTEQVAPGLLLPVAG